ncbi:MAG: hypothetical protein GY789_21205 [Hyphomicrobiales bacterium]|nr:hypothetical protein [Hyphomicrobiales bacterium]
MKQEWVDARATDTAKAYRAFLKRWPDSDHSSEAKKEIEKRYEFYTALINKTSQDGNLVVRWPVLLILGPVFLFAIGVGCLLLLGLTSLALSMIGLSSGVSTAIPVLAGAVLLIVKFGFGSESSTAFMSAIFVVLLAVLVVLILNWIGQDGWVSSFYQATGL